jgi:hypothetical protein
MKKSLLHLLCVCSALLLHACGNGTTSSSTQPPPTIATQLLVQPASSTTSAGSVLKVTVTAADTSGTLVPSYAGTVHFTSSDSQALLPPDSKLDKGTATFSATFKTAGGQGLQTADTVTAMLAGSAPITVNAGPATQLSVNTASAATVSMPFNVAVNALDAYMNAATNYAGTVHFSSSDTQATLPANSTLTNGLGDFSVTLKTVGSQTVTATDTVTASLKGSTGPINTVSNAATHLSFNGNSASLTRQSLNFGVIALDAANNISTGYAGTVHFTSSDIQAKLPSNTTLVAGTSTTLSATLETAGNQSITATDTVKATITGAATIAVTAASPISITSGTPPNGTVGVNYAPTRTEFLRCGGIFIMRTCVPCGPPLSACGNYPPCTNNFITCIETIQVFAGFTFKATGGVPPYTWSGSGMPPDLVVVALNGRITGTPTSPGPYTIAATATDSGLPAAHMSANYPITISNPPVPVVNNTPLPPGVENQPYTFTFTASGYPPLAWAETGSLPTGMSPLDSSTGTLTGTPTQTGSFPINVTATDKFKQSSAGVDFKLVVAAHGFLATGDMTAPRDLHTATLLSGGKVLVAGGLQGSGGIPILAADLYNPANGTFAPTGNMQLPRGAHTATLLPGSGKVLVAGGVTDSSGTATATGELYDPTAGTFSSTGSLQTARSGHTATLLNTGMVLIVGGKGSAGNPFALASAELYDPGTGVFTATGSMATGRTAHTATLLPNGKVLVAGGTDATAKNLASAETYDPGTGNFSAVTGTMTVTRSAHTANLFTSGLNSGKVLLGGGLDDSGKARNTAELFDPGSAGFAATNNMVSARANHTATLQSDGSTILLAGGLDGSGAALASVELFDSSAGSFAATGSLATARYNHTATLLANGKVLAAGGTVNAGSATASAEVYQ